MRISANDGRRALALPAVVAILLLLVGVAGCGSDDEEPSGGAEVQRGPTGGGDGLVPLDDVLGGGSDKPGGDGGSGGGGGGGDAGGSSLEPPPCPPDASNCAEASGQIVYIEAVDPDGDGDAHFVLLSAESITGPGLTVIDVEKELRPSPLPEVGDEVAASGPVYTGSYGQKQIEATALRVGN